MEIHSTESFLKYYENVRERTMRVVRCTPPDKIEWTCGEGRFTIGDLMRHLAATERYVFAENVQGKPSRYSGCGRDLAEGFEPVLGFMERLHRESVGIFSRLTDGDLNKKGVTPDGHPIAAWKLLRAMVEHEIHHRGQIYVYLGILGVTTPPLYTLREHELRALSVS